MNKNKNKNKIDNWRIIEVVCRQNRGEDELK